MALLARHISDISLLCFLHTTRVPVCYLCLSGLCVWCTICAATVQAPQASDQAVSLAALMAGLCMWCALVHSECSPKRLGPAFNPVRIRASLVGWPRQAQGDVLSKASIQAPGGQDPQGQPCMLFPRAPGGLASDPERVQAVAAAKPSSGVALSETKYWSA